MLRAGLISKVVIAALAVLACASVVYAQPGAQAGAAPAAGGPVWHMLGAALGLGMIAIGAGLGIGRLAAAAAEGIARQPSASAQITAAVNLPLFLLEGVAILGEVFALLIGLS